MRAISPLLTRVVDFEVSVPRLVVGVKKAPIMNNGKQLWTRNTVYDADREG